MIQTTLIFILGFLSAAFLALMVAPAIWRRAVALTRRRVEASVPLTIDEIQADKDRLRAEFAMASRRLEMNVRSLKEQVSEQAVEITRCREDIKRLNEEVADRDTAIAELEADAAALRAELDEREALIERLEESLADRERQLEERGLEIERLGRMYDEASFNASSRQIEIVAQEAKLEKLGSDLSALRAERKETDARMLEIAAESQASHEALRIERKKNAGLDRKLETLMSSLSDREEKLERRERELQRLRERLKKAGEGEADAPDPANEDEPADGEKASGRSKADRQRMERMLATLRRENKSLRDDLERAGAADGSENAVLRERIGELAADVVNLTAMLDGPDSPIRAILADAEPAAEGTVSLADRIRALQKSASRTPD